MKKHCRNRIAWRPPSRWRKTPPHGPRYRRFCVESLEPRLVLAAPSLGDLPAEVTVLAGAPLHLALNATDADGDPLTYAVSSGNAGLAASIPKQDAPHGNRSMRMSVQGFGDMVVEMFEGRAPRTTSRIIDIANSGWYNGKLFHRVIDGFMIQGGSRDGNGINGTGTTFDDEFDPTLQFTSADLWAMAKAGDDTNDSQFFITDTSTRWLDFNHSIFGMLTSGQDVRRAISQVATDASDRPLTDVVISSVEVFQDTQNAVMMLAAPEGQFLNTDVTVTVDDGHGGTDQKTIAVHVLPDTTLGNNSNPFLGPIDPITLQRDQPHTFTLPAVDVEGDPIFYHAQVLSSTSDLAVEVTADGQATLTPQNGLVGAFQVAFRVGASQASVTPDSNGNFNDSITDSQVVTVVIPPPAPTVEFAPGIDTGVKDNVTSLNNSPGNKLRFLVHGLLQNTNLKVFLNGVEIGHQVIQSIPQGDGSEFFVAQIEIAGDAPLDDGNYTVQVQQLLPLGADFGNQFLPGDPSPQFDFSVDTQPPAITSTPPTAAFQDQLYSYDVESNEEGAGVVYALQQPSPAGMAIDFQTGQIEWTPDLAQVGVHPLVVLAQDGAGNVARQEFDLTVFAPLVIEITGQTDVDEFQTVELLIAATDPTSQSDQPIEILLQQNDLPSGTAYTLQPVDAHSARFTWQTTEADGPGQYHLVFQASDNVRAQSSQAVDLAVGEVNAPPQLTRVFDQGDAEEAAAIQFDFLAADPDLPANQRLFSLVGDVPQGAHIDALTGRFAWTPDESQGGGLYHFNVRVADPAGGADEHPLSITVKENDLPPVFQPVGPQRVAEGQRLQLDLLARDPDLPANHLQYSLQGDAPPGLAVDAASGQLTWQVPENFLNGDVLASTLRVRVTATEIVSGGPTGLSSTQEVEITVADQLADLILATLTQTPPAQVSPPLEPPHAQPAMVDTAPPVSLVTSGSYDDRGMFGTEFGPQGAGGGTPMQPPPKDANKDDENPDQDSQSTSADHWEQFLEDLAGDVSDAAIQSLLLARDFQQPTVPASKSDTAAQPADSRPPHVARDTQQAPPHASQPTPQAALPGEDSPQGDRQSADRVATRRSARVA